MIWYDNDFTATVLSFSNGHRKRHEGNKNVYWFEEKLTRICCYFCLCICVFLIFKSWDFTQLVVLSLLSESFFCRSSPTPPGAPNFSTMAFVFLNCSSLIRCWTHFKYVSRVCLSGGTGTFGSTWCRENNRLLSGPQLLSVFCVFPVIHRGFIS